MSKLSYCFFPEVLYLCSYSLLSLPRLVLSVSDRHQTLSFPCPVTLCIRSRFLGVCFTPGWWYGALSKAPPALLLPCSSPTAMFWPAVSLLLPRDVMKPLAVSLPIQTWVKSWLKASEPSGTAAIKHQRCRITGQQSINATMAKIWHFSPSL